MFTAKKQEAYLKGFKIVEPGTFKSKDDGHEVAYDGYRAVILCLNNKNGELIDCPCRIPNVPQGEEIYVKLRNLPIMTKISTDIEIQFGKDGKSPKYFITGFEVAK